MTRTNRPGVYFVDTEGIFIDRGDDRVALILRGKRVDLANNGAEPPAGSNPDTISITRKECIDQIDLLDNKMRELESTIGELRHTYMLLSELK